MLAGLRVGKLDRLIEIRAPVVTQDSHGGMVRTFSTLAKVWAEIEWRSGDERLSSAEAMPIVDILVRVHWRNDFDETARIVHDGREYEIVYIAEIGRRQGLEILAKRP